jgi:hypothetical protein
VPGDVLSNIKVEPDESELELQLALKKARKLKLQDAAIESKNSIEKVCHLKCEVLNDPKDVSGYILRYICCVVLSVTSVLENVSALHLESGVGMFL